MNKTPDFAIVIEFEKRIAQFFGAPYAVAVDSCTHGIELCLRMNNIGIFPQQEYISCPKNTYLSVPMLASKLNIGLQWRDDNWKDYYYLDENIIDAAVLWKKDSYISNTFMSLSFQYQKHLSLGRGGMILCSNKESYDQLKKMSYDGRTPGTPWRDQDVDTMGYHYYMTPETALLGLEKLQDAIDKEPRQWVYTDWPNISKMKVFQK